VCDPHQRPLCTTPATRLAPALAPTLAPTRAPTLAQQPHDHPPTLAPKRPLINLKGAKGILAGKQSQSPPSGSNSDGNAPHQQHQKRRRVAHRCSCAPCSRAWCTCYWGCSTASRALPHPCGTRHPHQAHRRPRTSDSRTPKESRQCGLFGFPRVAKEGK
jgi:hypothetical protein